MLVFSAQAAQAQMSDTPNLTLNGFGTVGVVHSDENQADFAANILAPKGAGYTSDWSAEVDSRLGLQLTASLTPRLSSVVQVISEQRYDGTYKPKVEWANVRFEITPDFSVRAGRMVQSTFMSSEYRKVGYATPWVRPPLEVYRMIPVTNFDGLDASYRSRIGDVTHTLRGTYGKADARYQGGGTAEAREAMGLASTLEWGATTLFASYGQYRLTIEELNPFFDGFRFFGPEGEAIADRYDVDDKRFEVISFGARYDPGDWFLMGEWARSDSQTLIGDLRGWYVTGGVRVGAVTPYVTVARASVSSNLSDPGLSTEWMPPEWLPTAELFNETLNHLLLSSARQRSLSLGARWDFARNMALTAQYDHIDIDGGSQGILLNLQPGFEPGGTVNLFSLALDFVF
ncbi:hypothetical protein Q427_26100 [Halomonas sp. BC04]|nr:hypothetical protein Q427_26100 [Halomonas sp. BC04]